MRTPLKDRFLVDVEGAGDEQPGSSESDTTKSLWDPCDGASADVVSAGELLVFFGRAMVSEWDGERDEGDVNVEGDWVEDWR